MVLSKGTVAVTGVSGYVGSWCVRYLVAAGYQVRGTVRSLKNPSKVQHLAEMKEPVELFEADLLKPGTFDSCFTGCKAVLHVASPFLSNYKDAQTELIDPALKGTQNVLEACKRAGVNRVVLTSSCAAIQTQDSFREPEKFKGKVYSEKDWNDESTLTEGAYRMSKSLAEHAAWDFCKKNGIALTTICPNFVIGPPLSTRLDSVSVKTFKDFLEGKELGSACFGCVDVRDVAEAHVKALDIEAAKNERFLVGGQAGLTHLDLCNYLAMDERFKGKVRTALPKPPIYEPTYDNSKSREILGLVYRPVAAAVLEAGNFLVRNGLVNGFPAGDDNKE